jgi:hypothetical protein
LPCSDRLVTVSRPVSRILWVRFADLRQRGARGPDLRLTSRRVTLNHTRSSPAALPARYRVPAAARLSDRRRRRSEDVRQRRRVTRGLSGPSAVGRCTEVAAAARGRRERSRHVHASTTVLGRPAGRRHHRRTGRCPRRGPGRHHLQRDRLRSSRRRPRRGACRGAGRRQLQLRRLRRSRRERFTQVKSVHAFRY